MLIKIIFLFLPGSVLKFVEPYFPKEVQAELAKGGFKIRYTDYDWALNDLVSARK